MLPVDPRGAQWPRLAEQTVLVSIGDALPGAATAAEVVFDNAWGVTEALTQLAAAGHRHVAVLTPLADEHARPAGRGGRAHRRAEARHHAPNCTPPRTIWTAPTPPHLRCCDRPDRPTAVFCLADSIAYGVYEAARTFGLDIPGDVSVLGYDDRPVSRMLTPPLSTFHWPIDELVETVVQRTVRAVDEGKRSRRKVLRPVPVPRGSVGPPPR